MELIQQKHKASMEDFISRMSDDVLSNILNRLPLQEAVRTSILAKNWRFKWTMLSQLVFDENFKHALKTKGKKNYERIISRLLLHIKGVITKFVIYTEKKNHSVSVDEDINHWMMFLSRKGIKDLTFSMAVNFGPLLKLPTHLFSCLELENLKLHYYSWHPPSSFQGFPNLLSLELRFVEVESGDIGEFFTKFPALEILNMSFVYCGQNKVKLTEIAKLTNLKILSLLFCNLDDTMITSSDSILELVSFLPKLQELELNLEACKLTKDGVEERFYTAFPCLQTLKLSEIRLGVCMNLSCVLKMILRFPNLQTLEITGSRRDAGSGSDLDALRARCQEVDYSSVRFLQLRSVVFMCYTGSEDDVCFVKYLLACSPLLEKVVIGRYSVSKNLFGRKFLKLHGDALYVGAEYW